MEQTCNLISKFILYGYYSPETILTKRENLFKILTGVLIYTIIFSVTFILHFDKISFEIDWPLRQKESDISNLYEDFRNQETAAFISKDLFGIFITGLDLIFIWTGFLTTIYTGVQFVTSKKCKFIILTCSILKDYTNFIMIIFSIDLSKFETGFESFLFFAMKSFYKEEIFTTNINLTIKLFQLSNLQTHSVSKLQLYFWKLVKFLFYFSILYIGVSSIIMIPYIFIGIIPVLPLFIFWTIAAIGITRLILYPIITMIECIFKYDKKRSEYLKINDKIDPMQAVLIYNLNEREIESLNMFFMTVFSLKLCEILIYFSLCISLMILKGFNIFSIYYMFFSLPFMTFNSYTIQYKGIFDKIQDWKTKLLTYF